MPVQTPLPAGTFSIAELSREFGITQRTIRFYEDQGLLHPERLGQQRVFSRGDRTRLKLALRGKRLGLSLAEIKELILMYDPSRSENDHDDPAQLQRAIALVESRKKALLQQREDIEAVLDAVQSFENQCRSLLLAAEAREANAPPP